MPIGILKNVQHFATNRKIERSINMSRIQLGVPICSETSKNDTSTQTQLWYVL